MPEGADFPSPPWFHQDDLRRYSLITNLSDGLHICTPTMTLLPERPEVLPRFRLQVAVAVRDGGWKCHYCGTPLVPSDSPLDARRAVRRWPAQTYEGPPCPSGEHNHWPCQHGESWSAADGYTFAMLDHVVPKSRGGCDCIQNRVLACCSCNSSKGARLLEELPPAWPNPGHRPRVEVEVLPA